MPAAVERERLASGEKCLEGLDGGKQIGRVRAFDEVRSVRGCELSVCLVNEEAGLRALSRVRGEDARLREEVCDELDEHTA
jgi:hypothetical protein